MAELVWQFEHSVECHAPQEFAWEYWTDPANWDDPPARFEFDGPFAVGTTVTTILPGQKLRSVIREVQQGSGALIEMDFASAKVTFRWRFVKLATERTAITQRIALSGEGSAGLIEPAKAMELSVPEGMKRIAKRIERAWTETHRAGS
jgi:hypothetical protein